MMGTPPAAAALKTSVTVEPTRSAEAILTDGCDDCVSAAPPHADAIKAMTNRGTALRIDDRA